MATYRLSAKFFERLQQRFLFLTISISLLAVGVGIFKGASTAMPASLFISIPLIAVIVIPTTVFAVRRTLKQYRRLWSSYQLTLTEDSITRTQDGFSNTRIRRHEIAKISEYKGQGILIQSVAKAQILIPEMLEDFDTVRNLLNQWQAIEVQPVHQSLNVFLSLAAGIAPLIATYTIATLFKNRYLTAASLTIYLLYLLACTAILLRNSNVNRMIKSKLWWMVLPITSIAAAIITLLLA